MARWKETNSTFGEIRYISISKRRRESINFKSSSSPKKETLMKEMMSDDLNEKQIRLPRLISFLMALLRTFGRSKSDVEKNKCSFNRIFPYIFKAFDCGVGGKAEACRYGNYWIACRDESKLFYYLGRFSHQNSNAKIKFNLFHVSFSGKNEKIPIRVRYRKQNSEL